MKVYAPYKNFRFKHIGFPLGSRYCNDEEIKILKKVPLKLAELKLDNGAILNKPKPKKSKSKSKK